jgi:ubiquinone biosynthesis protein
MVWREAFQDLNRLRQVASIAARYGFADWVDRSGVLRRLGLSDKALVSEESTRSFSTAQRFRMMLAELGPTFVKLGQVLSTRADLLPSEFVEELASLQDRAPEVTLSEIEQQIEAAFDAPISKLFAHFEATPLAAASIAQVHRATLHTGEPVVVKVQRLHIAELIRADMSVLRSIAKLIDAAAQNSLVVSPTGIVDEFERSINEELDFFHEAASIRTFYENHRHRPSIRIPKVFDALSSRTVLTMEYLDAQKLNSASSSEAANQKLAHVMLDAAFAQLFEDGLFHGDPHPGNLLVLDGPRLGLIDFGLVGQLTRPMQDTLISLIMALSLKDSESVARILYRMGQPDGRTNLNAFRADIDQLLTTYLPNSLEQLNAKHLTRDLLNLAVRYRIRVPKEYAILARASVGLEGMIRSLYPALPVAETFLPYARKLLTDRYDIANWQDSALKVLFRLQNTASELPTQIQQILLDLENGKFTVTLKESQLGELNSQLRSLGVVIFAGLCACGFIAGTFIAFAQHPYEVFGIPVMGLLGLLALAGLFSTAVVRQVWGTIKRAGLRQILPRSGNVK